MTVGLFRAQNGPFKSRAVYDPGLAVGVLGSDVIEPAGAVRSTATSTATFAATLPSQLQAEISRSACGTGEYRTNSKAPTRSRFPPSPDRRPSRSPHCRGRSGRNWTRLGRHSAKKAPITKVLAEVSAASAIRRVAGDARRSRGNSDTKFPSAP